MENPQRINNPVPGNKGLTEEFLLDLWFEMYIKPQYGSFAKKSHINQNIRDFIKEAVKRYAKSQDCN